jgi:hypothetical protein
MDRSQEAEPLEDRAKAIRATGARLENPSDGSSYTPAIPQLFLRGRFPIEKFAP